MADRPHPNILDRERASSDVADRFGETLDLLAEVVNYGTNLLVRCLNGSKGKIRDIVAIGVFGKQVVALLDAIEQLGRGGAGLGAGIMHRAQLEASFYCEWILADSGDGRARSYYVANLRNEILWWRRAQPDSDEHRSFRAKMGELYRDPLEGLPDDERDPSIHIIALEKKLSEAGFALIDAEFEKMRQRRGYDPKWYVAAGAPNVRAIAQELDRLQEYAVMYSVFSEDTHATSYRKHVSFRPGRGIVYPIRSLHQLSEVFQVSLNCTLNTYRVLLNAYRSGEIQSFDRIYVSEWRERFLSIPEVDVEFKEKPKL